MKLTKASKNILIVLGLALIGAGLWFFTPGLKSAESLVVDSIGVDTQEVNNNITEPKLELPSAFAEKKPAKLNRIGMYAWSAQFGLMAANGGEYTTKGSFMEKNNVNLQLVRQDWLSELSNGLLLFADEYSSGQRYPRNQKAFTGIITMGDGAPYVISSIQKALDDKYSGKYHVQAIAAIGMSDGEDKVIGPLEWKDNPETARGSLISVVIGDGDWVVLCNWAAINNIPINPDASTYDEEAINLYASENDDFVNSAKELIKSQTGNFTVTLNVKKDGKVTSETVSKKIDGCATWAPADALALKELAPRGFVDVISTREFRNQMPTTLYVIKEWAERNQEEVTNMLTAIYSAGNQIKQYPEWEKFASECATRVYKSESPDFWRSIYKGYQLTGSHGSVNVGGSRVFNLADARQYYGLDGSGDKYETVYNQVGKYIVGLNPMNFNSLVGDVVPYTEAVNLTYVNGVKGINEGYIEEYNYEKEATTTISKGNFNIEFATGSSNIVDYSDLNSIYSILVQAEGTKVSIIGHTDNVGIDATNHPLSLDRAQAVASYLKSKGISPMRIQTVNGMGSYAPIADNNTQSGRRKNRRVEISLLQ